MQIMEKSCFAGARFTCQKNIAVSVLNKVVGKLQFMVYGGHGFPDHERYYRFSLRMIRIVLQKFKIIISYFLDRRLLLFFSCRASLAKKSNFPEFESSFTRRLCAEHGTRLKGEPIISNYGSQGKSQAQRDGGEGHSVITKGYPVTMSRKVVALLRWNNTKA
jgi:hypothetical protein